MMQTVVQALWIVALVGHGIAIVFVARELGWKYRFQGWSLAWGSLLLALVLGLVPRVLTLWDAQVTAAPRVFLEVGVFLAVSVLYWHGFWRLSHIFDMELPSGTPTLASIVIDAQSVIRQWSPNATRIFGWTEAEAVGQTLMDTVIPPAAHEAHQRGVAAYLATGIPGRYLTRTVAVQARHKDGHEFPVEALITVQRTPDGAMEFHGTFRRLIVL